MSPDQERQRWDGDLIPDHTPDLTYGIMARLGYRPASDLQARRTRRRRQTERAVMLVTGLALVTLAMTIHTRSEFARRSTTPSLPAALGEEVKHHQRQIDRALRTIRTLAPPPPVTTPDIDGDVERSAVGPMRWL